MKKLIQKSLEKEPIDVKITLNTGKSFSREMFNKELLKLYEKLQDEGFFKISIIRESFPRTDLLGNFKGMGTREFYYFSLTEKSKDYILETKRDKYSKEEVYINIIRTYTAELEKVTDIHIIPQTNTAEATATFITKNKTPFFILEGDQTESFTQTVTFVKTEDEGWKIMDKYWKIIRLVY